MHEFYLMCDDIEAFVGQMKKERVEGEPVQDMGWGLLSQSFSPAGFNEPTRFCYLRGHCVSRTHRPFPQTRTMIAAYLRPPDGVTLPAAALPGFRMLRSASMKRKWSGGSAQSNSVP